MVPENITPIPPRALQIWIGEAMPDHLVKNVIENSQFLHTRMEYESILYVDAASPEVLNEMKEVFSGTLVRVKDLKQTTFYRRFAETSLHDFYVRATHGPNRNLAMASDILRFPLLKKRGGIYIDVDDKFILPSTEETFERGPVRLAQNDLGFGKITTASFLKYRRLLGNTPLASHKDNVLLDQISDEMLSRLQKHADFFDQPRPRKTKPSNPKMSLSTTERNYISRISEMTGLDLLNDVMRKYRIGWMEYVTAPDAHKWQALIGGELGKTLRNVEDYMMTFWRHIPVNHGNEHSWRWTR